MLRRNAYGHTSQARYYAKLIWNIFSFPITLKSHGFNLYFLVLHTMSRVLRVHLSGRNCTVRGHSILPRKSSLTILRFAEGHQCSVPTHAESSLSKGIPIPYRARIKALDWSFYGKRRIRAPLECILHKYEKR